LLISLVLTLAPLGPGLLWLLIPVGKVV